MLNYYEFRIPRILSLSLPFITIGIGLKKYENDLNNLPKITPLVICIVLSYIEWLIFRYYNVISEIYFLTPPLFLLCFVTLQALNFNINSSFFNTLSIVGEKHSLFIYIYHRCIYLFLVLIFGFSILPFAAIICFFLTALISILISKIQRL